ncbi:PepSY domain-containing protein [Kribbella sp. NBC_00709]|uniref:PepSY-associated TM helix domain-containing protein n=1 Tax=Kribbella sp. NBC_00709 TaxID=2975972 RepID=UPI002E2D86B8|nr:PepSY domain-containing protein [Kribbella sp. NBC_00709]
MGQDVLRTAEESEQTGRPARVRWWRDGFQPILTRLHFYVGIFVAPFILVAATTGLLYTTMPQVEQLVYADYLKVPAGATPLPLAEQVRAAQATQPDGVITEVRPATGRTDTTRVSFTSPSVPEDYARTAFVDPYTGHVHGSLTTFGEWLPLRAWFDGLHRTLLLGNFGRLYSELAASWLWVLAVSGGALWIVRRRKQGHRRRLVLPGRHKPGRRRALSWHGPLGLWILAGMLFLSVTGLTWSQFAGNNVSELRSNLTWSTPSPLTNTGAVDHIARADVPAAIERAEQTARGAGLDGLIKIVPAEKGAWLVGQAKRSWPEKQDQIAVDPGTGKVLERVDFADWPLAAKLARWGIDAHMGLLLGIVNQLLLAALAITLITMICLGYRMWWLRRPRGADRRTQLAPPLSTGRAPHRVAVLVIACLAIPIGVFAPMLGGSLLLFLVIDLLRDARPRLGRQPDDNPATN